MHVINARNVHQALPAGLDYLNREGELRESRAGKVLVAPEPVTTVYRAPRERVLFWPERNANPFFHLMESLWMLAGRNDVEFLTRYVKRMSQFSDDGHTLHGAYGHRWIGHFALVSDDENDGMPINQLATIAAMLHKNPEERRCVLAMWDPSIDLARKGKDLPCNTHAYFGIDSSGRLNMTVCNRSNDIIWGAYGANAVHFSIMQEYLAAMIDCEVGSYHQVSNNYHAYVSVFDDMVDLAKHAPDPLRRQERCPYTMNEVGAYKMVNTPAEEWRQDLLMFLDEGVVIGLRDPFFRRVVVPIEMSHRAYREGSGRDRYLKALEIIEQCAASDWRVACTEWLQRGLERYDRAQDDGPSYRTD